MITRTYRVLKIFIFLTSFMKLALVVNELPNRLAKLNALVKYYCAI